MSDTNGNSTGARGRALLALGCAGLATVVAAAAAGRPQETETDPPPAGEFERRVLAVLEELDGERGGNMNVPREDGRLLRVLAQAIGAKRAVEIGTSNGYSAIWIALALKSTGGHLVTHEIDPGRAARARANFERAGVADLITVVLGDAHEKVRELEGPIDLLFIDADKPGYLDYLEQCLPKVRPGGLILAHNMNRPAPDARFVEAITTRAELETLFLHMDAAGMALTLKKE